MKMKRKFNKKTTLKEMTDFLEKTGCKEIRRILPYEDCFVVEWN